MQKATIDQPAYNQHGALLIKTTLVTGGVSFYIADQAGRVDDLSKSFTDHAEAAAFYRHVAYAAEQGKRTYQIVWEVQALEEAQTAASGRTEDEVADAINADADLTQAAVVAEHNRVVALVQDALASGGESYAQWRASLRKQVAVQANCNLSRFAQANTTRPANLTAAQNHIVTLAARNGGRIVRGGQAGQANSKQIIALHGAGIATITYGKVGNTQVITGGQLTAKGFRYAGVELGSAA